MQVPLTTGSATQTLPALGQFVRRLAAQLAPGAAGPAPAGDTPAASPTLTPAMLRAALLEMGAAATPQNLALAEAFAHLGLALTAETLAGAHAALARAPRASPPAYALARAWSLPATPAALNALTAVAGAGGRTPPEAALPPALLSWLGLALDAGAEPEELAAHLFLMAQGAGRSTEHRLLHRPDGADLLDLRDARTTLLRLAQGSDDRAIRQGADALAAHIEGQQLVNQAARQQQPQSPFYLAVPTQMGAEAALAEMRLWPWEADGDTEAGEDAPWLRATVRLATARLGRVQADLVGTLSGALACRLGAERPATVRLLQRHAGALAASLSAGADWPTSDVHCRAQSEWPPLWHGGDALAAPRPCVDWRA